MLLFGQGMSSMDHSALQDWVNFKLKNHDASHDAVHASNVVRICKTIMANDSEFQCDVFVQDAIVAIAWTHDICDQKYVDDKDQVVGEIVTTLREIGMAEKSLEVVLAVVGTVSFSARLARVAAEGGSGVGEPDLSGDNLVAYRVVSDADMLEAMGIVGMMRTFMYQAVNKHTSSSAFSHIQNRLLLCKEYLFFQWSVHEGMQRHSAMVLACAHLSRERCPI